MSLLGAGPKQRGTQCNAMNALLCSCAAFSAWVILPLRNIAYIYEVIKCLSPSIRYTECIYDFEMKNMHYFAL